VKEGVPLTKGKKLSFSEAGASEMMREVNIRKRFALLYHLSFIIYLLAKFTSRLRRLLLKSETFLGNNFVI